MCYAWPVGILVIGVLVNLVMILQFIIYEMHRSAASALRIWRTGMGLIIQGLRGLAWG